MGFNALVPSTAGTIEEAADFGGPSQLAAQGGSHGVARKSARFVTKRGCGIASITAAAVARSPTGGMEDPSPAHRAPPAGPQEVAMVASSATETRAVPKGVPQWRVLAGDLAAGATAGAAVEAALYPIDTIKTRLQAMTEGGGIRALIQRGGGKSLYAGVWGNLAGVMPASALFMAIYEPAKVHLPPLLPANLAFLAPFTAGAAAGLGSSIIRVPTEVVKQRMQTGEFKRATTAVRTILAQEGLRGMYAGYSSFLLRDLPFDAIEFFSYEQGKTLWKAAVGGRELTPVETSEIGACAGAFTGLITTPLDVLKTRMMTQGSTKAYSGVLDCAMKIAKNEGGAAFFRGWEPRVTWIGIGGCVFFTALEASRKLYAPKAQAKELN